jgi:hypothetical protein
MQIAEILVYAVSMHRHYKMSSNMLNLDVTVSLCFSPKRIPPPPVGTFNCSPLRTECIQPFERPKFHRDIEKSLLC